MVYNTKLKQRATEIESTLIKLHPQNESWFNDALQVLGIEEGPGWPDKFGQAINKWFKNNSVKPIPTLSLFTGAGGLDMGFHDASFHAQEMVEFEKKFVASLSENSKKGSYFEGSKPKCIDIKDYNPSSQIAVDFIIGGPPCQTFSSAGRRASGVMGTDDPRGLLFMEYVRLLKKLKPRGFLFENVYGIIGAQGGRAWEEIKNAFREAGYTISYRILDAADYGVPQHRERIFIVGLKEGSFKFPYPTHGPDSTDNRPHYSAGLAVRDVVHDEPYKKVNGRYGHLLDSIPPGLNYSFYTQKLGHPNPVFAWRSKFSDFLYKADPQLPVRAIKAQGGQYTGPFSWENRYFTVNELKRLQTFPDLFRLVGGRQVAIQQIGNSVPPQIGRILGLAILDQVFSVKLPFQIKYMPDDHQLNFRNRKRLLTEHYGLQAAKAIKNISKNKGEEVVENKREKMVRFLGPSFEWYSKETPNFQRITISKIIRNNILELSIGKVNSKKGFDIIIEPTNPESSWPISYEKIRLTSYDFRREDITSLWKSLEEIIRSESGIADLVQFSGYYQYSPAITISLKYLHTIKGKGFWSFLKTITGTKGALQLTLTQFELLLGIKKRDVVSLFKELRKLGFEIRNHNTNPQIKMDTYLIPYVFPTLRPDSVQLKKSL